MTILLLAVFLWSLCALFQRQLRMRPARITATPPATAYDAKAAERERKQAAKRREIVQAVYYERDNLDLLYPLLDAAKAAYKDAAGEKFRERYAKKIISLRKQIAASEARLEKARYILQYGG